MEYRLKGHGRLDPKSRFDLRIHEFTATLTTIMNLSLILMYCVVVAYKMMYCI